jgi:hypothetical protein
VGEIPTNFNKYKNTFDRKYMACNTVTLIGINGKCDQSAGGIKRVLIIQRDEVEKVKVDWDAETQTGTGEITELTLKTDSYFKQWLFRKGTGSMTTTLSSDPAIGTSAVTTDLNLQFTKAEAKKRLEIQAAINAAAVVIVEDMYGQYIYLGLDNEVSVTAANMQTGTAITDLNGFTLTLQDVSLELPHFIKDTVDVEAMVQTLED